MADAELTFNLLLRGGAISVLALIAGLLWHEHPRSTAARLGALFAVSLVAATIASMPGFATLPRGVRLLIAALAPGSMFLFWLFTRALFDDVFALRRWHACVWAALAIAGVANCTAGETFPPAPWLPALQLALVVVPVALALLAIAQSVASWREDLVERRRHVRTLIVATTAFYTVAQLLVALVFWVSLRAVFESTANAGGIAALTLFVAWRLLRLRKGALFEVAVPSTVPPPESHPSDPARLALVTLVPRRSDPTPADHRHLEALDTLMTIDHLYREPRQSVGALAEHMGLPEHKLRRLINQGLGYRNFSAFLNTYRLADARRWLSDPAQRSTPILTIAMDAGFQSIGPFNRAFKAETGVTPSEFRRLGGQSLAAVSPGLAESGIG